MAKTDERELTPHEINVIERYGSGKVTGYKVMAQWSTVLGQASSVEHKIGETLAPGDVTVPKGEDRKAHIAELVNIGVLQPIFEQEPVVEVSDDPKATSGSPATDEPSEAVRQARQAMAATEPVERG